MFERPKFQRRILFLLLSVILLFISVGMTKGNQGEMKGPEGWLKNGFVFIQGFFYTSTYDFLSLFSTESKEFAMSLEQKAERDQLEVKVNKLEQENEQLKRLIGYQEEKSIQYISARVAYRSPNRWNNRVVINRGAKDGVLPRMPIITSQGLIGRVQAVTDHMADIQLLTDAGNGASNPGIAAVIQKDKQETLGIIEGFHAESNSLIMNKIPASARPEKGQLVVTSGLSDVYTGDLLIGTVERVEIGETGVDQKVFVKPAAHFERLDYVLVVNDPTKLQLSQHQKQTKVQTGGEKR
ncbi:rod shape-determining protein MreC [Hazenella coriacea]|uniref:Cell shape-determining protein MreC n=1 Tax=Hazenella coriacea TaxID=1179467 RepID=A0A4R3L9V9_9BACL|nr:rod shape-determining protein MreC [Hazenella coriacea]TCS96499.1 rod shape-determining protein MreC [Hazenella coriacea]